MDTSVQLMYTYSLLYTNILDFDTAFGFTAMKNLPCPPATTSPNLHNAHNLVHDVHDVIYCSQFNAANASELRYQHCITM